MAMTMKKPTSLTATPTATMVTMATAMATTTMTYTEHDKFQLWDEQVKHDDEVHSNTATTAQTTRER